MILFIIHLNKGSHLRFFDAKKATKKAGDRQFLIWALLLVKKDGTLWGPASLPKLAILFSFQTAQEKRNKRETLAATQLHSQITSVPPSRIFLLLTSIFPEYSLRFCLPGFPVPDNIMNLSNLLCSGQIQKCAFIQAGCTTDFQLMMSGFIVPFPTFFCWPVFMSFKSKITC